MKKLMPIFVAFLLAVLTTALPAKARRGHGGHGGGHFRIGVFVGPTLWWPAWGGYPSYYRYYPERHIIVQQQPEEYVQQVPQTEEPLYWYFCPDPQGYYPYVKTCPKGWLKVVPPESPPEGAPEGEE